MANPEQDVVQALVDKFFSGLASEAEKGELAAYVDRVTDDEKLGEALELAWQKHEPQLAMPDEMSGRIVTFLFGEKRGDEEPMVREKRIDEEAVIRLPEARVGFIRRFGWVAAVLLLIAVAGLLWRDQLAPKDIVVTRPVSDVRAPDINRATLQLSSGERIVLDSVGNGRLAVQGNVSIVKQADGQVIYSGRADEGTYNSISNPRGSSVVGITLGDGTKAWLNAGSYLRYPVAFSGSERRVEMTGEVYFEVNNDERSRPFIVQKDTMEILVLGTRFNVNAYTDEAAVRVTLLQGRVNVREGRAVSTLAPGQQAQVSDRIVVNSDVNPDQVIAWKNEKFDFGEGTDLHSIMRQIARWYDVEVEYRGAVDQSFGGSVSRQVNISKVLEKLALTDRVKFQLEGRKVIVLP